VILLLSEAQRSIKNRDAPFISILIGWHGVIGVSLAEYSNFLGLDIKSFPFLHVAFALESMLLLICPFHIKPKNFLDGQEP